MAKRTVRQQRADMVARAMELFQLNMESLSISQSGVRFKASKPRRDPVEWIKPRVLATARVVERIRLAMGSVYYASA